jgi:hypothetical protein
MLLDGFGALALIIALLWNWYERPQANRTLSPRSFTLGCNLRTKASVGGANAFAYTSVNAIEPPQAFVAGFCNGQVGMGNTGLVDLWI